MRKSIGLCCFSGVRIFPTLFSVQFLVHLTTAKNLITGVKPLRNLSFGSRESTCRSVQLWDALSAPVSHEEVSDAHRCVMGLQGTPQLWTLFHEVESVACTMHKGVYWLSPSGRRNHCDKKNDFCIGIDLQSCWFSITSPTMSNTLTGGKDKYSCKQKR